MSKYEKWSIIRKLLCSTFRIWKKICKFAKIEFFIAKSSYKVKMFPKKFVPKMKNYTFLKSPCPCHFKYAKNFLWQVVWKKFAILFRKTCAIRFLMSKAFQKAKFYQNLTSGSGLKHRFSLLQEKAVIQAVCLRTQAVSIKARF